VAIEYVGGTSNTGTGASINLTVNSGLTGGIGSAAAPGDIIVVFWGFGGTTNATMTVSSPAGYSVISDLYSNDTWDSNFGFAYKVQGSTPDTTVTVNSSNSASYGGGAVAMVFRGVEPTNPLDQTTATNSASNQSSSAADPPSITPQTPGAWVVAGGIGMQTTAGAAFTTPANMDTTDAISVKSDGTTSDAGVFGAYYSGWTSGAFDPNAVTGGTTSASSSHASVTLALRPFLPPGLLVAAPLTPGQYRFR
jgi:hypothetical protein